jgi:hypothetical protein
MIESSIDTELALESIKKINFEDRAASCEHIMRNFSYKVDEIHADVKTVISEKIINLAQSRNESSPLIVPIQGQGGSGKTFLLSDLYHKTLENGGYFAALELPHLSAISDNHEDFYKEINLRILICLMDDYDGKIPQIVGLVYGIMKDLYASSDLPKDLKSFNADLDKDPRLFNSMTMIHNLLNKLKEKYPSQTKNRTDIIRSIFFLATNNRKLSNIAFSYLTDLDLESYLSNNLQIESVNVTHKDIFYVLNWLMSINNSFTVLAIDQLDNVIKKDSSNFSSVKNNINKLRGIFSELYQKTKRTLIIVTILSDVWIRFGQYRSKNSINYFEPNINLHPINNSKIMELIVLNRIKSAYETTGFYPPYPTFPFPAPFFKAMEGSFPRTILSECSNHQRQCSLQNKVIEWSDGHSDEKVPEDLNEPLNRFNELIKNMDTEQFKTLESETEFWQKALNILATSFIDENPSLPERVEIVQNSVGSSKNITLANVALSFQKNSVPVRTLNIWVNLQANAIAFKTRLNSALTISNIQKDILDKRLILIRFSLPPSGPKTSELINQFVSKGGIRVTPSNEEIAKLNALTSINQEYPALWQSFAKSQKPIMSLEFIKDNLLWLLGDEEKMKD